MLRIACLLGCCILLAGTSCPGSSSLLTCSNNLDGSAFGFSLTVPAEYECAPTIPNPVALANVGYRQASTGFAASVQVSPPQSGSIGDGLTVEDLGGVTNPNGFAFTRQKVTLEGIGISYVGGSVLDGGNNLFITLSAPSDDPALLQALDAIIATVNTATAAP
ncbi:MAG: hypothetical protein ACE5E1_02520 [Phycisphaerae bacterium]